LKCAEAPNTIVKVSAFVHRSASPWPHADLYPLIQGAVDAFGPARSVFGTDWPHAISYGPYEKSLNLLDMCLDLDDGDRELVLGGTATRVWFSRPTNK
jgi:L-fuconolactonase